MELTADLIEAFAGTYLSHRYDAAAPTPAFHRETWTRYADVTIQSAATAAPRKHAKTTAFTQTFGIAAGVFRWQEYIMLLGSSEELAMEMLTDVADEFRDNEDLRRDFCVRGFLVEQKGEIIVEFEDGWQLRYIARGAEQKIRGRKWHGKRIGLIIADDMEDDEQVESKERRDKFRRWFFRAAKQALRDGGFIRAHGTILHIDSLLAHLMVNKAWSSRLYKAHESFDDFGHILWPQKFPAAKLKAIRDELVAEGDSAGYSQEYLNDPLDNAEAYLKREWYLPMSGEDHERFKVFAVGADLAISKADRTNRTSFTVGGKDVENTLHHVDQYVGRWDTLEIVDKFFEIQALWNPLVWFLEGGAIWRAVEPILYSEMKKRDSYLNIEVLNPDKDKGRRGMAYRKRMKAGACRFDVKAEWFAGFQDEQLKFTGSAQSRLDDQFDSAALLSLGLENWQVEEGDELTDEEEEMERTSHRLRGGEGRSAVTGY